MTILPPRPTDGLAPTAPKTRPPRRSRIPIVATIAGLALVAGIVAVTQRTGERASASPSPTAVSPNPDVPLMPVIDLEGRGRPYEVTLRWSAPASANEGARYEIRRDGMFVGYVDLPRRRFVDDDVIPGSTYSYAVRVETTDGTFSDARSIRVKTTLPPLSLARLRGTFDVRSSFVSKVGYGEYSAPGFGWRFKPTCDEGACAVHLRDIGRDDLRITLRPTGGTYTGTFRGRFGLECSGTPTISSGSVTLRIEKAKVIDRVWRVTSFSGTLTHTEAAQLGCRYSSAELSLRGRFYG